MIDTIEAQEAWWPPTFTSPSSFSRRWLALCTIQEDSQSRRCSMDFSASKSVIAKSPVLAVCAGRTAI